MALSLLPTASNGVAPATATMASMQQTNGQRTIRLVDMVDMLIQKSYHDLVVLAELLARKPDLERKMLLMQYLSRTHNYLVRFLALLKWSSNMSKVEKCFGIVGFLEEQSALFVETADVLARMARETLANSKLPCYQVSFAVDVLNSKTSPRLPSCIKERTVREEPLSPQDSEATLAELEYALLHRLLTFDRPPPEMRNFLIRRGRVTFTVHEEFQVSLTVMGEDKTMSFRVLDLKILVRHRRVGEGRPLVHPQQVMYLIQLLQSRIMDHEKPLNEVYEFLHTFCQGLQLEVIYSQLAKYMADSGMEYYRIESYSPTKELKLSYWDEYGKKDNKTFSLIISAGSSVNLQLSHRPSLPVGVPLVSLDVGALMISVIHVRIKQRLEKLHLDLSRHFTCLMGGLPALLIIPLYPGAPRTQSVQISVDYYTGMYLAYLKELPTSKYVQAVRDYLNSAWNISLEKVVELLRHVRLEMTLELVRKCSLHVSLQEHTLSRLHGNEAYERFNQLGSFKAAFRFQKKPESNVLLIVSCHSDLSQEDGVRLEPYIAFIEFNNFGTKIVSLISLTSFSVNSHPDEVRNSLNVHSLKNPLDLLKNRLRSMKENRGTFFMASSVAKFHPVALDHFSHIVSNRLSQMVFCDLRAALKNRGFVAEYVQVEQSQGIITLPVVVAHPAIRSCIFRRMDKLHTAANSAYHVDVLFSAIAFSKKPCPITVGFAYDGSLAAEKVADLFTYEYLTMLSFVRMMDELRLPAENQLKVTFDGKLVEVYYGAGLQFLMTLTWDRFSRKLVMDFHCTGGIAWNPHRALREKLMHLMENYRLQQVCDILQQTAPLALAIRSSARVVGVARVPRSLIPQMTFQFISLSFSHFVVAWRTTFALSIRILPGPKFIVTDIGASDICRNSDNAKFMPIVGLRSYLENVLGNHLVCSAEAKSEVFSTIDADLEAALNRFFLPLSSCLVQLVESSCLH